jgi:anti-sigma28 factor (negative regulator of flagellin synthesis)
MQNPNTTLYAVDVHRVSRLRDQLAEDTYEVNPQQIASKMIDMELAIGIAFTSANRSSFHA